MRFCFRPARRRDRGCRHPDRHPVPVGGGRRPDRRTPGAPRRRRPRAGGSLGELSGYGRIPTRSLSSHLVEHTIQLDKTLVRLGLHPSEVDRLVRRLHGTYGHLEAVVNPMSAGLLAIVDERGCSVDRVLGELAAELTAVARSARAATGTV